jgi:protein arginine kinase activator
MKCELCHQKTASVHVTEITRSPEDARIVSEQHICEACAGKMDLPSSGVVVKKGHDIWKLLTKSAQIARMIGPSCPDCGMSLAEFRSKGRVGCPKDYEIFRAHLDPLLLRVHGAREHRGRLPGISETDRARIQQLHSLRARLEEAIRDEAYESAARLRDEIQELESSPQTP